MLLYLLSLAVIEKKEDNTLLDAYICCITVGCMKKCCITTLNC